MRSRAQFSFICLSWWAKALNRLAHPIWPISPHFTYFALVGSLLTQCGVVDPT